MCRLCASGKGDEIHYMLYCPGLDNVRNEYIKPHIRTINNKNDVYILNELLFTVN